MIYDADVLNAYIFRNRIAFHKKEIYNILKARNFSISQVCEKKGEKVT